MEYDALIYSLFAEIEERWIKAPALVEFLKKQGVFHDEAVRVAWRARGMPKGKSVRRILIAAADRRIAAESGRVQAVVLLGLSGALVVKVTDASGSPVGTTVTFQITEEPTRWMLSSPVEGNRRRRHRTRARGSLPSRSRLEATS